MAFAGIRGTGDFGTDERPKDFRESILYLDPNGRAPIFALTSKAGDGEDLTDPEFAWWEESLDVVRLVNSAALNTVTTTVEIQPSGTGSAGNGLDLVVGDLLMVEPLQSTITTNYTYEIVEVSVINTTTSFTVIRGAAGTTAGNIPAAQILTKVGNVFAEGTSSPEASSRNPTKKYNYVQIFKTAYELTGTVLETKARTGDPLKNDKKRKMFDHAAALEMALIFGRRNEGTWTNGKPRRFTGGLLDPNIGIGTAVLATSATAETLMDVLEPIYQQTKPGIPTERIAFCGAGFLTKLNKLIAAQTTTVFQNMGELKLYGLNLTRMIFPWGEIAFKLHPLLTRNTFHTNSCIVLAPPTVKIRNLRKTRFQDNIQNNDEDTKKGQWLTEMGIEIQHASLNKHIYFRTA
jgi:hypothetical protein